MLRKILNSQIIILKKGFIIYKLIHIYYNFICVAGLLSR